MRSNPKAVEFRIEIKSTKLNLTAQTSEQWIIARIIAEIYLDGELSGDDCTLNYWEREEGSSQWNQVNWTF